MDKRTRSGRPSRHPGLRELKGRCQVSYTDSSKKRRQILTRYLYNEAGIKRAVRERNRLIRQDAATASKIPTFAQIAQLWLNSTELTPSSRKSSKGILNTHWMPILGDLPVSDIRYSDLRQIMASKTALAPKTRKNVLASIRSVLALAVQSDYIQTNPAAQFGKIKADSKEIDPFTLEERDSILGELQGRALLFYAIRFYLGTRPGETIALDWANYDGERITVKGQTVIGKSRETTKTGRARTVLVHSYVQGLLREHPTRFQGGRIFVNQYGNTYTRYNSFAVTFNEARERLGIRYRSPYNVRHTAATIMLRATRDPLWVAGQLGNSTEMIYRHYAGVIFEDRDEEMRKRLEEYM